MFPGFGGRHGRYLLNAGVAAVAVYLVFNLFYSPRLWGILLTARPLPLALAASTYSLAILCSSLRLRRLVSRGFSTPLLNVHWANLYGMFMGEFTPGRSGYLFSILPLKRAGIREGTALSAILLVQVLDFLVRAAVAMAALVYFSYSAQMLTGSQAATMAAMAVLVIALVLGSFFTVARTTLAARLLRRIRAPVARRIEGGLTELRALTSSSREAWRPLLLLTLLSWLLTSLRWYWIGAAIGVALDPLLFLLLQPLLGTLAFVPLSVGGLGIIEGGIVAFLLLLGITPPVALAFALLDRTIAVAVEAPGLGVQFKRWASKG